MFSGTARYYARYRPGYPAELIAHVVRRFGLDGTGRLLDLGCGTGQLALPLAPHVGHVVGMDPEPAMLREAATQARLAGVVNVEWVTGGSDDLLELRERLVPLRLVTIGRAFHWMDGDATLAALDRLVEPGGGLLLAGEACGIWSGDAPWQQVVRAMLRRWLGGERRAGSGIYQVREERWEHTLARSPFRRVELYRQQLTRHWTVEYILGLLLSTSFASAAVLGDRRDVVERDLRDRLLALDPSGVFSEELELEAHLAWRDEQPAAVRPRAD
jgi:ubiquinone/menaquinone biosynthesis C-methylase UbiE